MRYLIKNLLIVFLIFLIISGIFTLLTGPTEKIKEISLSQLVEQINQEKVSQIVVKDGHLEIEFKDGGQAKAQKEKESSLTESLKNYGVDSEKLNLVNLEIKEESGWGLWLGAILPFLLPFLIIGAFLWFMLRGARQGQMQAFSFGRSRARLFTPENQKEKVTFNDVAGLKEAKTELQEIVEFLKNPKKFTELGAKIPKGVLLIGAPGTGKTLLARAVASEARVPFFHVSGSEFVEMFVGVGSSTSYDTKVLIRTNSSTKLMKIGEFVDQFYKKNEEGFEVPIKDTWTLGANWTKGNKFFKSSSWKKVKAVYRHKVDKIYEIDFIGGKIKVTGNHSIFVRNWNHIICKKVSELKVGDVLIGLPYSVRGKYNAELALGSRATHYAKAHQFPEKLPIKELIIWPPDYETGNHIPWSISAPPSIAKILGFATNQVAGLKTLSENLVYKVKITPALMKLLGYYTAEGWHHSSALKYGFGIHEKDLHKDCINLMREVFHLEPKFYKTKNNALQIEYYSMPIAQWFMKYCGQGACNKHIPEFLWDLPKEYFVSYLEGLVAGDGYINKRKMIEFSSCSEQLISELRWLLNMHGIPCSITKYKKPAGHRIKNGKPLPESIYWRITIARRINPLSQNPSPIFFKRPIIKKIKVKPYNDYVYDLCGCENEAFFGGEKPILLHNSRVRDLFQTAKKNSPCIIFLDELDAIGRQRGIGFSGAHDEREQTLNQILVEMDGFEPNSGVIVLSASITGNTPVLVKQNGEYKLTPIKEIIDAYYQENEEGIEKPVTDLEVLGFEKKIPKGAKQCKHLYFENSAFKKVRSVFRHKVNEIYEVKYRGGIIRTTGNHSLFVRTPQGVKKKLVSEMKPGDILVDLPYKVNKGNQKLREIKVYECNSEFNLELLVWRPLFEKFEPVNFAYQYALAHTNEISQTQLGKILGFSQRTIGKWQQRICGPRTLSRNYYQHKDILPEKIKVTPELMRLFGYYVAEGYARKEIDFCLNRDEKEKIEDVKNLMKKIFNLEPDKIRFITPGAINIIYYCKPLADFFVNYCGQGAKNKHIPQFLFEAPKEYFIEFLQGYVAGDGHLVKKGRNKGNLVLISVSKRLLLELNWLSRMYGFEPYFSEFENQEKRRIKDGKPLKSSHAYRLEYGKTTNPFINFERKGSIHPLTVIKKITKLSYNGYVYDFCGCDNEAFFAGEKPVLASNTNRPDVLDVALLRPGRFDRRIILDEPDINDREEVLKIHTRDKHLARDANLREIAERTPGFSGADLANLVNEAALLAARRDKKAIGQDELRECIEKVLLGPERKSHILSKKEKEIAAYHEAGHALVNASLPHTDPIHKVSIISRGRAAGYTLKLPVEDKHLRSRSEFLDELAVLLGGYAAEELIFKELTTGAASDLKMASDLARKLVTQYGMSEKLGPVTFGSGQELAFWGREIPTEKNYSEEIAAQIDQEVAKFIDSAYQTAKKILIEKRTKLEKIAKHLIKKETIERKEFERIMGKVTRKRGLKKGVLTKVRTLE